MYYKKMRMGYCDEDTSLNHSCEMRSQFKSFFFLIFFMHIINLTFKFVENSIKHFPISFAFFDH